MFGADRPVIVMHKVMQGLLDCITQIAKVIAAAPMRWKDIVVQVAVTQMSETVDPEIPQFGNCGATVFDERRDGADRDRDIVARDRANASVGFGNVFTHCPKFSPLRFGLCNKTILGKARLTGGLEQGLKGLGGRNAFGHTNICQNRPFGQVVKGKTKIGQSGLQKFQARPVYQLECRDGFAKV